MRILVVNDDGIKAPGIKRLVQMAAGLGEVWVVASHGSTVQCHVTPDHCAWRFRGKTV